MKRFDLAALFAIVALPTNTSAVVPANGGVVGGMVVTVSASSGDQNDPHLDGDTVSFTDYTGSSSRVAYFDFVGLTTTLVPAPPGEQDLLSDVSAGRISFSRVSSDRTSAMLFDTSAMTLTEVDRQSGTNRLGTAIGSDTLAFVDLLTGSRDVLVHDLAASSVPVNVSASLLDRDGNPTVSPDGNAIAWVRESDSSGTGTGILMSLRSGAVWGAPSVASDTAFNESNPATDGTTVVYDSDRASAVGGADVYFRSLFGGAETQLEIAGAQQNPEVHEGVLVFQSTAPTPGAKPDLFVYVIATNMLWQVTDTPDLDEGLSDISVLPTGEVRVVWAVGESSSPIANHDIYARTFSIPLGGDTTPPSVAIAAPADGALFTKDQVVLADYACADEPGGSGVSSCAGPVASGAPIDTTGVGGHLFTVIGTDNAGNSSTVEHGYGVVFCVNPFAPPVDDLPVLNRVNAGRAIPLNLSLCGDQGLAIFAAGYPKSQQVACDSSAPVDGVEETLTAGNSSLSYDAAADQYKYVWKTEKSWAGSCRQLVLLLSDGAYRRANFQFR